MQNYGAAVAGLSADAFRGVAWGLEWASRLPDAVSFLHWAGYVGDRFDRHRGVGW